MYEFSYNKMILTFFSDFITKLGYSLGLALFKDIFRNGRSTQYYTIFIGRTEVLSYHIKPNVFFANSYDNIFSRMSKVMDIERKIY